MQLYTMLVRASGQAMWRREFIGFLIGAAVTWPLATHAQQPAMPVIGFLDPRSPDALADRLRAFHRGLKDAGYIEHENVTIEYRWAEKSAFIPAASSKAPSLRTCRWCSRISSNYSSTPRSLGCLALPFQPHCLHAPTA